MDEYFPIILGVATLLAFGLYMLVNYIIFLQTDKQDGEKK
jgi:hypothetical protein